MPGLLLTANFRSGQKITPWVAGQTSPAWSILCQRDGNPMDLTGQLTSYISVLFYNNVATSIINGNVSYTKVATGAGAVTIPSFNPGIIKYAPVSADTVSLAPGQYWIRVEVLMGGTAPDYSDYIALFVGA